MASCIPLQPVEAQVVGQCVQALCTAVHSKFGCTAIFHGMNANSWENSAAKKSKFTPEKKYSIYLPNGLNVSVWKDDLTTHKVDAVVNAANEDLHHVGGLALALAQSGGPTIQQESNHITKNYRKVKTGTAVVTSAGNLPCKKIIHAVGPHVSPNAPQWEIRSASTYLSEAIESILKKAEENNLQSVAIPAISSGLFNFPLDHCADIIVSRLENYDAYTHRHNKVMDVRLVNHDDRTVSEMVRACKQFFGDPKTSYSGAVMASGRKSDLSPVKLGKVTLHVTQGLIEKQKTSVIVNTTGPDLDLSNGAVTRAILREAGYKLQDEVKNHRRKHTWGDVVKTKGYNLNASNVYHVLCVHKGTPGLKAEQILSDTITKCLVMADIDRHTSIAFPAIGCGELRFSKREAADIMTKAVKDFSSSYKGPSMDIYIVIFPAEKETFQAFAEKQASLQQSKPHASTSYMGKSESPVHEQMDYASTPAIEVRGNFPEAVRAAKRWINDVLEILRNSSAAYTIRNNHVLHFGLREHEELLSLQTKFEVGLQVAFSGSQAGQACINIKGSPSGVTAAVLEVEAMCCRVQQDHALEEEASMLYSLVRWRCKECRLLEDPEINAALEKAYLAGNEIFSIDSNTRINLIMKEVTTKDSTAKYKIERICFFKHYILGPGFTLKSYFGRKLKEHTKEPKVFREAGLQVERGEIVENYALEQHFALIKKRISSKPKCVYQRVPAQCCQLVSWVGFQRDYAPPLVQAHGEGIYFTGSVKSAMELWKGVEEEEYVYIIEAEVLTGKDTFGSPSLIVPPPIISTDPLLRYDSLKGGKDTVVIFNGHQALPKCIYTCKRTNQGSSV